MKIDKILHYFVITTMTCLYLITSILSTYHVIDFFELSNPRSLAISLAIAFEIGAAASLASIVVMHKMNKPLIWVLFIILTAIQVNGNLFYSYSHLTNFNSWSELFGLSEDDIITQKRILSIISGAILPIVALLYVKCLVDYIKPSDHGQIVHEDVHVTETPIVDPSTGIIKVNGITDELIIPKDIHLPSPSYDPEPIDISKLPEDITPHTEENKIEVPNEVEIVPEPVIEDNRPYEIVQQSVENIDSNGIHKGNLLKEIKVFK